MDAVLTCHGQVSLQIRSAAEQLIDEGVLASAVCRAETASTNSDALAEMGIASDALLPRLHVTDHQTAGRGRQGNRWQSESDSLTFSLVTLFDLHGPAGGVLSLAVGVAVAEALEYVCAPCRVVLKWPNDICINATGRTGGPTELRKLGGILIETSGSVNGRLVIGIGLNLNQSPSLGDATSTPPASLAELVDRGVDRFETLVAVVSRVLESIDGLKDDPAEVIRQYRSRCILQGKHLSFSQADQLVTGQCVGVTDDGALELMVDGQRRQFRSGQVQRIRPAPGR